MLFWLRPSNKISSMDVDTKVSKILSLSSDKSLGEALKAKLSSKPEFTVFHLFEPNGRLTLAHAVRYLIASKVVAECGGKYILFVSDVRAEQDFYFNADPKQIKASVDYALKVFELLGVLGPHVQVLKSSEFSLNNYDLFYQMVSNSLKVSIKNVKDTVKPVGKEFHSSALISPCQTVTEVQFLNSDIVLTSPDLQNQYDLLKTFQPENTPIVLPLHGFLNLKNTTPVKPDPKNTFFFEDQLSEIQKKSNGAYCTDDTNGNPVFQYISFLLLLLNGEFEFNGKKYATIEDIAADFPTMDKKELKACLAQNVEKLIEPVRNAFQTPELQPIKNAVAKMTTTVQ